MRFGLLGDAITLMSSMVQRGLSQGKQASIGIHSPWGVKGNIQVDKGAWKG